MTCIDTHVHFWQYNKERDAWMDDMKVLQQDYIPEMVEPVLKRNDVDGCVAVQADQSELETRFLCELAKTHAFIKGVVGWVDLCADNAEERLQHFTSYKEIRGYRHIVQGEPNDFLLRKDFQHGVKLLKSFNYTYDVLIYHYQLKPTLSFISALPDQKMVIDHCAKPDIRNKEIKEWARLMKEIAQNPNVYCKLSGLFTEARWKAWGAGDFYPYLDVVFEAFGTDRLMYGSDWPVILVSGMYVQWKSLLEKYMENYDEEEKEKVLGLNAVSFYQL
ncbi:MAG: amidohydrolase family protein [Chitinophagaceae bacterium]|nr:amidohydrolase family protein [Chitinophagaceae bacterium]